jgi:hypothetical protein
MAHPLALICPSTRALHDGSGNRERCCRVLPALLVAAATLLPAHGVAAADDLRRLSPQAPRAQLVTQLQGMPEDRLRQMYLRCAHISNERLLDPDEAVLCVVTADVLLARAFAGDFAALIAWYQRNRDPVPVLEQR